MRLDSRCFADVSSTGRAFCLLRGRGRLLKLVDRTDLGSVGENHESSSLSPPTIGTCWRKCHEPQPEGRGLCLASAATRKGDPSALASLTDTSGAKAPGHHDKVPVPLQACRRSNVVRPRTFYLSLGSGSERPTFSWKGTMQANCLSPAHRSALACMHSIAQRFKRCKRVRAAHAFLSSPRMNAGASRKETW